MNNIYEFNSTNLLNWITAFAIFEIPLAKFYLTISNKNDTVYNWYSGKNINIFHVLIQDLLYALCGIIIALRLFNYLVFNNIIASYFIFFILCLIFVQLIGDSIFALIIVNIPYKYSNYWINYFKNYIAKSGINALIGDSIYVIVWASTYYFVVNYIKSFDVKIFINSLFIFLASAYSIKKSNK